MTQPSLGTWRQLVVSWIFAPRRTVLGMVRAAAVDRHHAAYHRLFAAARWSVDQAGLAVYDLALRQTRQNHLENLPLPASIEKILRPLEELIALAA